MTTEQLNSLVIGKTLFINNGNVYRLSSFLYVYKTTDGDKRRSYVDRKNANSVSGSGISGCICNIDDIIILEDTVETDSFIISSEQEEKRISDDKNTYEFLSSLEPNLSEEQLRDIVIDSIMKKYKK